MYKYIYSIHVYNTLISTLIFTNYTYSRKKSSILKLYKGHNYDHFVIHV